jgi:transcription antitermination factor NusG
MDLNPWHAVRVRAQQEVIASQSLKCRGLEEYLPLYQARRLWSDRVQVVSRPILTGYVFCRFSANQLTTVLDAAGCAQVVKVGAKLALVPEEDILALKRLVEGGLATPHPYVIEGTRVRVRVGAFKGIEGYVKRVDNRDHLIVSLPLLQRSVAVQLEADSVEPIHRR